MFARFVGVLIVGVATEAAVACDCKPPPPPKEALEQAKAVFSGKVLKIADAGNHYRDITLQVALTWKGAAKIEVVVRTTDNDGTCGYAFQPGKSYLVYASEEKDKVKTYLFTNSCSRTKLLDTADDDLKDLGAGKKPE